MLHALSKFANNTDFYNPVGKPVHNLLSRKEKIKGRVLPLLGQVSLFALSVGMSAMTGGLSDAALGVGVLGAVSAYLRHSRHSNYKKKLSPENVYDPNTAADVERFKAKYPDHPDLPAQLCRLSQEAGLEKAPLIHVGKNTSFAAIVDLNFWKKQELVIEINTKLLEEETPELLSHVLGHELGHGRLGHTNSLPSVLSGTAVATHISVGVQFALSGNYLSGIFYAATAIAGHSIANAKSQQYKERECDRHALLVSGVAPEAAEFFNKLGPAPDKNHPAGLRAILGVIDTLESLTSAHPNSRKRADYMCSFNQTNKDYLEQKRAQNGFASYKPKRMLNFRMV